MSEAWPRLVVIEVGAPLTKLIQESKSLELPFIDLDVVLEQIVDSLMDYVTADLELLHLPNELLDNEYLTSRAEFPQRHDNICFDDFGDCIFGLEYIANLCRRLGMELKSLFKLYRLFEEDSLKYEFNGIMDERTIILRFRHGGRHAY